MGCTTKAGAAVVYIFPALYGTLMIVAGAVELQRHQVFGSVCITFGAVYVLTSVVGELGVCCLNEAAIRATVVLVVLENIIAFILATFFLVDVVRAHPVVKEHQHTSPVLTFLATHEAVSIYICVFLYIGAIATSCCIGFLSEYQAQLDAELLMQESRQLQESERAALLRTSGRLVSRTLGSLDQTPNAAATEFTNGVNEDMFAHQFSTLQRAAAACSVVKQDEQFQPGFVQQCVTNPERI
ncbi:putative transmembrane protein [Toxoplasma gondii p89]|uniref:Putative transmembrane protein n=1 Tax=Toxoplasma gondii p89 TaxID=943119 RepID=A0A086KR84_TOXGO|nr:putative transmembrane protein [Toxoplasma gondii p89]